MDVHRKVSVAVVRTSRKKDNSNHKGPLRFTRLCVLTILLPGILIAGPLYLRYRVYSGQIYPVGMTDMRLVDKKISTTWCQKQLVKSNATFNAYLLPEEPQFKPNPVYVSMVRHLDLSDDMKEYWGFYLLKGSSFTVSTCCRWPGAFLAVIKGHKQLKECAYFGDDSSEEEDELEEIKRDKEAKEDTAQSNEPLMMKKARPGVIFYGSHQEDSSNKHRLSKEIGSDLDNEQFHEWVPVKSGKYKNKTFKKNKKNIDNKEEKETYASRTKVTKVKEEKVEKNEHVNRNIKESVESPKNDSEEIYHDVLNKIQGLGHRGKNLLLRLSEKLSYVNQNSSLKNKREISWHSIVKDLNKDDDDFDAAAEEEGHGKDDIRGTLNETTLNDKSDSEYWSSFSSSEERLLDCAGLIINLPLIPKKNCQASSPEEAQEKASLANKFTYKVPSNGYYFFIFSSENEVQSNHIRVHFHLQKVIYNVSNPVAACTNTTESCSLPLNFFSSEKTVLEMPLTNNDSMWNEEFVVVSVCEPRTAIYAACVIAVPVLILLFAF